MNFPEGFAWGAATSAYQYEGAAREDGRGPSIWDVFCRRPGAVTDGESGDTACDGYHRFAEDIALMARLGLRHYRFSLSWPRILPAGRGVVNARGLAYYDAVVDCCLQNGIEPWVTLYHWDLPAALDGGWERRETAAAFADFAGLAAAHFRGRVRSWITLNEPQCIVALGYGRGIHAPGRTLGTAGQFACWRNLLAANALAARRIREACPDARVGIVTTGDMCYPRTPADETAARTLSFSDGGDWAFTHHWFLDPVCLGRFPETEDPLLSACARAVPAEELSLFKTPMDFLGLNLYNGHEAAWTHGEAAAVPKYPGFPRTALKWPVTPAVLRWGPRFVWERYGLPVVITENGMAANDRVYLDGQVHDPDRVDYLHRYLLALGGAVADGVPVLGYFHWSLTDNFEWQSGYAERFGLVYVDYRTQARLPKDSALWYASVIRENGQSL